MGIPSGLSRLCALYPRSFAVNLLAFIYPHLRHLICQFTDIEKIFTL